MTLEHFWITKENFLPFYGESFRLAVTEGSTTSKTRTTVAKKQAASSTSTTI